MNESTQAEATPNSGRIGSLLENARRRLLETGTRNRLIHVNRANQRANCLNMINERSDHVFAVLRTSGRKMKFKATGRDRNEQDDDTRLETLDHSSAEFARGCATAELHHHQGRDLTLRHSPARRDHPIRSR